MSAWQHDIRRGFWRVNATERTVEIKPPQGRPAVLSVQDLEHLLRQLSPNEAHGDRGNEESQESSVSRDENELRQAFGDIRERVAADWASSNLAVVIHRAGAAGWAGAAERHRERATLMLAVRLFRAIRATMAVLGAGYEVEGRAMVRLVLETRARLLEVTGDESHETGRRWLDGKPDTSISGAVRASAPELDAVAAKRLYGGLSQDSHADVGGIMRTLATVDEDLRAAISWGPQRTFDTRLSLLLCGTFAAEAATLLAVEAEVEHPHREALSRYLQQTEAALRAAEARRAG